MTYFEYALATDQADISAVAVRCELQERGRGIGPEPIDPFEAADLAVIRARDVAGPFERIVETAKGDLTDARDTLRRPERQHGDGGPIGRLRIRDELATARRSLEQAQERLDVAVEDAGPARALGAQAVDHRDTSQREQEIERARRRLDAFAREAVTRPGHELDIGR